MIYLASPYSHPDPVVHKERFHPGYCPPRHITVHHGFERTVLIGPRAQRALARVQTIYELYLHAESYPARPLLRSMALAFVERRELHSALRRLVRRLAPASREARNACASSDVNGYGVPRFSERQTQRKARP